MPIVTIQVTRQGTVPGADSTTEDQKAALYKGVSSLLYEVMGKHPDDTFVLLQEVEMQDWGRGGVPVADWFARNKRSPDQNLPGG